MTTDQESHKDKTTEKNGAHGRREIVDYAVRRFGVYLFTLWAAITVAFFVFRLVPGDPMSIMLGNLSRAEGHQPDPEEMEVIIAHYREIFGLDDPLPLQYVNYLRKAILGGLDLGPSFVEYPAQTRDLVFRRMPWTLGIFTTSVLLAWIIGTGLGALIGWLQRSRLSQLAVMLSTLLQITPVYLVALGLIIYVGYTMARSTRRWSLCPAFAAGMDLGVHQQPIDARHFADALQYDRYRRRLHTWHARAHDQRVGRRLSDLRQSQGFDALNDPQRLRFPQCADTASNRSCHHRRHDAKRNFHH